MGRIVAYMIWQAANGVEGYLELSTFHLTPLRPRVYLITVALLELSGIFLLSQCDNVECAPEFSIQVNGRTLPAQYMQMKKETKQVFCYISCRFGFVAGKNIFIVVLISQSEISQFVGSIDQYQHRRVCVFLTICKQKVRIEAVMV